MLNLINESYFYIYSVYIGFIPFGYFSNYEDAKSCVDRFNILVPADYKISKILVKR